MVKFELDMKEIEKTIKKLGKIPQKCVTKAAKAGAKIPLNDARQNAPEGESKQLKKGIVLKGEKSRYKAKKVYQVTFDEKMNDVFVKMTKDGKRYYYPASQEYGFKTVDGGYVQGKHFMRNSIVNNARTMEKKMVQVLSKEIDKLK